MSLQTALERTQLVIESQRGELVLEAGRVTLRTPALSGDGPMCVEFGIDRIRDTQLRAPTRGARGWLHVGVVGGSPAPPGELAAMGDPYTLPLSSAATPNARRFARLVERHVRERGMPTESGADALAGSTAVAVTRAPRAAADGSPPPVEARPSAPGTSIAGAELVGELQALADLRARGALTEGEFERAKARLLG